MPAAPASRHVALAAVDGTCPRCGARRRADSAYCADCGLRLPAVRGVVPALRRRWLRTVGWYPGDWIWISLLTLVVAAAGSAGAIVAARDRSPGRTPTLVATEPPAPAATTPIGKQKQPAVTNGRVHWPAGTNGWTVVLGSFPLIRSRPAAEAAADRAARLGLPQVGTLDSGRWPSLNPGYDVVFSGVYATAADAQTALPRARHAGFGGAYPRQIAR